MEHEAIHSAEPPSIKPETASSGVKPANAKPKPRQRNRKSDQPEDEDPSKRRCVSTACIACRKRKSKCDGNLPACAACSQVYGTECIYDPNSDHRRKGVYKNDIDSLKTRNSTLQTLITALLNGEEHEAFNLVREIRSCESLDEVANRIAVNEHGLAIEEDEHDSGQPVMQNGASFERQFYSKMGDLRLDDGSVRYIGGTSHLIHVNDDNGADESDDYTQQENPVLSWTRATDDPELIMHLLSMYFGWHYTYFTTLSKTLFYRDFMIGYNPNARRKTHYCTPLLVNAMLALGCHFTSHKGARESADDPATAGDHFFREAKRLILEGDLHEIPRLTTVQALALMSVREAGCAREAKGWVYSGMSFRMACDMGLSLDSGQLTKNKHVNGDEAEEDVRRITFWGCFLFDKCWSNYLGRLPQLPSSIVTVPKFEVFPDEDSAQWVPYTDSGPNQAHAQPARTRAVSLQIVKLCEISNDLMAYFYNPSDMEKSRGKAAELKMLSSIHTRLETWRRELPKEMEPREGCLPSLLIMHMFFQLLYIHLFRPMLKYNQATSPLPQTVSPRKLCTQAAQMISKLMRLYKRSHGLKQIVNLAVYILHTALTIHLLSLPDDKNARRDIVHGVKHLEEIAESWLCARRTLGILSRLARNWEVELPEEAAVVLQRTDVKFGHYASDASPSQRTNEMKPSQFTAQQTWPKSGEMVSANGYSNQASMPTVAGGGLHVVPAVNSPAQQYPPASSTPQNFRNVDSRKARSPSDMFGGIEQLIRDSQDWVMRDQAQLATGFENWSGVGMDPSVWPNGMPSMSGPSMVGGLSGAPLATGMPVPNAQPYRPPMSEPGTNVSAVDEWLYGVDPNANLATYNGDEYQWYQ